MATASGIKLAGRRGGCRAAVAAVLAAVLGAAPAGAITNGMPDGEQHPAVGGLVASVPYSDGSWMTCSGTLVSSTVFVTAAHCGDAGTEVAVTFDTAYEPGDPVHHGTFTPDPLYGHAQGDPHDVAVVALDEPIAGIVPALLPRAGSLGRLAAGESLTSVGYGAHEVVRGPGGLVFVFDDVRMTATGTLRATTPSWLRLSVNPATGDGGGCSGDSGGPTFLGTTDIVAAITVSGDVPCRATVGAYRLDTDSARAFLAQYVELL